MPFRKACGPVRAGSNTVRVPGVWDLFNSYYKIKPSPHEFLTKGRLFWGFEVLRFRWNANLDANLYANSFLSRTPSTRMEASHNLPLDILRLLLEFSASASIKSAKALSLVSKEVQAWTDPHLFQIVKGRFIDLKYRISLLDRMCMSDASPRLVLARNYVRAVAWRRFQDSSSQSSEELSVIIQKYLALRRVAICIDSGLNVTPDAFESPFWTTVTHLYLNSYRPISSPRSSFQQCLFVTMPSLMHLALYVIVGPGEIDAELAFSRVTQTFPLSLKLCLFGFYHPRTGNKQPLITEMASISQKFDERIVMWSMIPEDNSDEVVGVSVDDSFQAWGVVQDEVQTFWQMGEAVLKKKQVLRTL
ncbi:hypothetical protein DL96DRAFT_1679452 [Flagelloscypha sp. PMI_526]|nr:hypothetical protein DL96DRAFT_1679452 [Flagelloscypha sp. PMI_526]